jgi:GH24 family phage-related lysozyme (muramidase)
MPDSRNIFNDFIKKVEGHSDEVYADSKGVPTVGTGLNLDDETVQGLMNLRGINPEEVKSGQRKLATEEMDDIHNQYMDKRTGLVRSQVGEDLYDTLKPNEKAALMSMGYQSLNNLGPNLKGHIASDDKIGAMREMILNTNKDQDPGILNRRMQEAELFGGPLDFSSAFKTMSPEEKRQLMDTFNKLKNENVKAEALKKYGSYLNDAPPAQFNKLQDLLKTKMGNNQ